jgi:hypothetical protein
MLERSKPKGQKKGVSNSSGSGGWLVSPPLKTRSPRNLIQGLGLEGIPGKELRHGNWIMILAHGTYNHCKRRGLYNPYYTKCKTINWNF